MKKLKKLRKPILYINAGLEFGFAIAIGILLGYILDRKLGTKPYLTFIFFGFGVVAAFKNLFRSLKILEKMDDNHQES